MRKLATYLIILGSIGVGINMLFGTGTISFIHKYTNSFTGITYLKIDFYNYIANIQKTFMSIDEFVFQAPTRQWTADLVNNLKVIADYLIFIINILTYPIRIGAYVVKLLLAVIGIDLYNQTESGLAWIIAFIRIVANGIPYI